MSAANPGPRAQAFALAEGIVRELAAAEDIRDEDRRAYIIALIRRAKAVRQELDRTQR